MAEEAEKSVVEIVSKNGWGVKAKDWISQKNETGAQFASNLISGVLTVEIPLIIKTKPKEEFKRRVLQSDDQFHNEVLVYKHILPMLGADDLAPKMYVGISDAGGEDIVALQRMDGFEPCKQRPFLDLDHLLLILRSLGKFHAKSYNAKKRGDLPGEIALKLRKVGFGTKRPEDYEYFLVTCMKRAIEPVPRNPDVEELLEALKDLPRMIKKLESGSEPLSVICHGDFCSNNVMFKYDGSKPLDIRFIDFQTSRYSTPCIDLAFFLYLNTSSEMRASYWDLLFETYLQAVESNVMGTPPNREEFKKEFETKALYGLVHCSFFLPVMLSTEVPKWDNEEFNICHMGGNAATKCLVEIFTHMLEKGFIRAFLNDLKMNL